VHHARALRAEARAVNERRGLVLTGDPDTTRTRAAAALAAAGVETGVYIGPSVDAVPTDVLSARRPAQLLGTTSKAVVLDCHERCQPNTIGRAVGAVDGGGLFVMLTPPLAEWPAQRDAFDASLAVPPFGSDAVTGRFRRRLVETLRAHRGITVVSPDGIISADGLTTPLPRASQPDSSVPAETTTTATLTFPDWAYAACRTQEQVDAVAALEQLCGSGTAVVIEAHRGRGKSSAAGLAAAALAAAGDDVLVTAPHYRSAQALFTRAREHLGGSEKDSERSIDAGPASGQIRFERPTVAADQASEPDSVIVDEAAGVPVSLLETLLAAESIAFTTTVHGYEGAGRGFSVRFRDRLAESSFTVTDVALTEPIRYAPGDPLEVWSFRALALDARPPVASLITAATPESVSYRSLGADELINDEQLLKEVFGLLVAAHYRTEPNDLARLLDAPNVSVHALTHDEHVVSVALVAREGGLSQSQCAALYAGDQIRGHLLPDVLSHQLRDEAAGRPVGDRVLRIATHDVVRSHGLGAHLLAALRDRADGDWIGAAFGATPALCRFWRHNGYQTIHLSTTRNDRSGERSAFVIDPLTPAGEALAKRHATWFRDRAPGTFTDALADADPAVIRAACRGARAPPPLSFSDHERRFLAGIPAGAAVFETAPEPVQTLVFRQLIQQKASLSKRTELALVRRVLQAAGWTETAAKFGFTSARTCKQAIGAAVGKLLTVYGDRQLNEERERLAEIRDRD
jgi:Predicted P-loop ATPase fused to an acetyltransferase